MACPCPDCKKVVKNNDRNIPNVVCKCRCRDCVAGHNKKDPRCIQCWFAMPHVFKCSQCGGSYTDWWRHAGGYNCYNWRLKGSVAKYNNG